MMKMRSAVWVCLVVLMLVSQGDEAAGQGANGSAVGPALRVGVVPAPPITAIDAASLKPKGYAIDLVNAIAERSGLKVEYQPVDWANMAAALQSKRIDVVVGPIFRTEARAKEFIFTEPVWSYAIVGVKRKDNAEVNSREDLVSKPVRIAVGRGGFDHEFARRMMRKADIRALPPEQPDASMLEILSGRTDVALVDKATAERFLAVHQELTYVADGAPMSLQLAGFMLNPKDWRLREFLDVALENLAVSGEMSVLAVPYQAGDPWFGLPLVEWYDVAARRK